MFSIFQAKTVHFFSISNQNSQNLYPIYEKKTRRRTIRKLVLRAFPSGSSKTKFCASVSPRILGYYLKRILVQIISLTEVIQ